jgi:hypothetical protein
LLSLSLVSCSFWRKPPEQIRFFRSNPTSDVFQI